MLTPDQRNLLFRHYPVLAELDRDLLDRVLDRSEAVSLAAGTQVFEELQACTAFPFILAGEIRVYKQALNGRELSLYSVAPGDACVVTAGCLLGDEPYNAAGKVRADCAVVMTPEGEFERLLTSRPFREYIFGLFSQRILGLMQLVEEVAFRKLDQRLAGWLLNQEGPIKTSHQALADELGTVREMVTRLLNSLADSGLVSLSRGSIKILDRPGLEKTAAG